MACSASGSAAAAEFESRFLRVPNLPEGVELADEQVPLSPWAAAIVPPKSAQHLIRALGATLPLPTDVRMCFRGRGGGPMFALV